MLTSFLNWLVIMTLGEEALRSSLQMHDMGAIQRFDHCEDCAKSVIQFDDGIHAQLAFQLDVL